MQSDSTRRSGDFISPRSDGNLIKSLPGRLADCVCRQNGSNRRNSFLNLLRREPHLSKLFPDQFFDCILQLFVPVPKDPLQQWSRFE